MATTKWSGDNTDLAETEPKSKTWKTDKYSKCWDKIKNVYKIQKNHLFYSVGNTMPGVTFDIPVPFSWYPEVIKLIYWLLSDAGTRSWLWQWHMDVWLYGLSTAYWFTIMYLNHYNALQGSCNEKLEIGILHF